MSFTYQPLRYRIPHSRVCDIDQYFLYPRGYRRSCINSLIRVLAIYPLALSNVQDTKNGTVVLKKKSLQRKKIVEINSDLRTEKNEKLEVSLENYRIYFFRIRIRLRTWDIEALMSTCV